MIRFAPRLGGVSAMLLMVGACEAAPQHSEDGDDAVPEVAPSIQAAAPDAIPAGLDGEQVARGRELYVVCAVCHGLDGDGTSLGPSLRDSDWIHITGTAEEIAGIIGSGVANPQVYPVPMPEMGGGDFDPGGLDAL